MLAYSAVGLDLPVVDVATLDRSTTLLVPSSQVLP
jgi:hypothetical protein